LLNASIKLAGVSQSLPKDPNYPALPEPFFKKLYIFLYYDILHDNNGKT